MSNHPIPSSLPEFTRMFSTESLCENYLFDVRWPDGFRCPKCGGSRYWERSTRRTFVCASCGVDVHLTAGTIFHKSKMPLQTWFYATFIDTILTPGMSAVQFQKVMGLTRYETAFQMLHKIRSAMVNPEGRDLLAGVVELDETYVGGVRVGGQGGRTVGEKTLVVGAVEVRASKDDGKGSHTYAGRVRFRVVPNASGATLMGFVQENVAKDSVVVTDGWSGYSGLWEAGYDHRVALSDEPSEKGWLRLIHLEFSNMKTEIKGIYHGRVEEQHLQTYLNEFAFRHNRRFLPHGFGFLRVLQYGMHRRAPTWAQIYSADQYGRNVHVSGLGYAEEEGC